MAGKRDKEGYLLIDHRASPGVPAEVARQFGFDPRFMGEGSIMEAPTLTCSHCKGSVVLNPERIRKREYCSKCDDYMCDACYALTQLPDYVHAPYMQISDLLLNDAEKGTQAGISILLLNNPNARRKEREMTWKEFVAEVNRQLVDGKVPDDAPLTFIAWDRDQQPNGIYVNLMEDGSINIVED